MTKHQHCKLRFFLTICKLLHLFLCTSYNISTLASPIDGDQYFNNNNVYTASPKAMLLMKQHVLGSVVLTTEATKQRYEASSGSCPPRNVDKKLAAVSQLRSTAGLQIKRHSNPKQVSSPQPKTHDVVILYAGRNQIRKITSIAIKDTQTPSGTGEITYPNNTEEETYLQVRYHCTPNSVLLDRRGQHTAQEKTSRSRNFQEQEPTLQEYM